jgi:molecular chaperone DnaK
MTITGGTALGKDEIDRMVKEAEAFAAEDHRRREAAEARNQADQLTYQVDQFLQENGDKLPDADRAELTTKNDELKQVLKDEAAETDALRSGTEALLQVWQRAGQALHQQAAAQQQAAAGGGGETSTPDTDEGSGDEDVVEGEIVDEGGAS